MDLIFYLAFLKNGTSYALLYIHLYFYFICTEKKNSGEVALAALENDANLEYGAVFP